MRGRYPTPNRCSARHVKRRLWRKPIWWLPVETSGFYQTFYFHSNCWQFFRNFPVNQRKGLFALCGTFLTLQGSFSCREISISRTNIKMQGWEELQFLLNPLCVSSSLHPLSPLPQFRRPSMTQFEPARKREGARLECFEGWDMPHCSLTHPYVTQTDHVTWLCSSRGKPKHYLCLSSFLVLIWLCKPLAYTTTCRRTHKIKRRRDQLTGRKTKKRDKDLQMQIEFKVAKVEKPYIHIALQLYEFQVKE